MTEAPPPKLKDITRADFKKSRKRGKDADKLREKTKRLIAVRLKKEEEPRDGLERGSVYIVLGEVEKSRHFILSNLRTGQLLPGMIELDRFERVNLEDR